LALGGVGLGTLLSHRLAADRLQKMFAVLVLTVSLFLFSQELRGFVLESVKKVFGGF